MSASYGTCKDVYGTGGTSGTRDFNGTDRILRSLNPSNVIPRPLSSASLPVAPPRPRPVVVDVASFLRIPNLEGALWTQDGLYAGHGVSAGGRNCDEAPSCAEPKIIFQSYASPGTDPSGLTRSIGYSESNAYAFLSAAVIHRRFVVSSVCNPVVTFPQYWLEFKPFTIDSTGNICINNICTSKCGECNSCRRIGCVLYHIRLPANSTAEFNNGTMVVPTSPCDFICRRDFNYRLTLTSEASRGRVGSEVQPRYIMSSADIARSSGGPTSPYGSAFAMIGGSENVSARITIYEPLPVRALYKTLLHICEDECGKIQVRGDVDCGLIIFRRDDCCGNDGLETVLRTCYCASRNGMGVQLQIIAAGAPRVYHEGIANGTHQVHVTHNPDWYTAPVRNGVFEGEAGFNAQVPLSQVPYTGRECDMGTVLYLEFEYQER